MRIEFQAYADDCIVRGQLTLEGERLSDYLADAAEIELQQVTVRALHDGREHDLASASVSREELCVVVATGPRGRADRRLRTRAYPIRADVGPYTVIGWLHAMPTADPRSSALRRQVVALSPGRLEFTIADDKVEESHETLLLMRTKITLFESASDEELGLSKAFGISSEVDPQAKDFTGDVRAPRPEKLSRDERA